MCQNSLSDTGLARLPPVSGQTAGTGAGTISHPARGDYLATQSANGTYDNETDRAALQKEVNQLRDEINRIVTLYSLPS